MANSDGPRLALPGTLARAVRMYDAGLTLPRGEAPLHPKRKPHDYLFLGLRSVHRPLLHAASASNVNPAMEHSMLWSRYRHPMP